MALGYSRLTVRQRGWQLEKGGRFGCCALTYGHGAETRGMALNGFDALPADQVVRVGACRLRVAPWRWAYAEQHAGDIDAHWLRRQREQPAMFNGRIFLVCAAELAHGVLSADFFATEFKAYLYWREQGHPETGVRDGFGSALIRSADGAVLLGRQRAGNVNAGLVYPPGGFVDARDVAADGRIDIAASIAREVGEETGLPPTHFAPGPGFHVTFAGPHISMAREFVSPLAAEALRAEIAARLAGDPASELTELVAVRRAAEIEPSAPLYGRLLVASVVG